VSDGLGGIPLMRALQLASPALPIGAYAYSQGLEWAVEAGWVHDEASAAAWLAEQFQESLCAVDVPVLARLHDAASRGDGDALATWGVRLLAMRETRELVADDSDRGRALARLLVDLGVVAAAALPPALLPLATPTALAAVAWALPVATAAELYCWGWLENQVLCAVKLVPLGQVAGQRLLAGLAATLPAAIAEALGRDDDDIGGSLPDLALASALHETQYTRLFRS